LVLALDALQRPLQTLDQIGGGHALDYGVAVVADSIDVRSDLVV
jgi:hypothetical protein